MFPSPISAPTPSRSQQWDAWDFQLNRSGKGVYEPPSEREWMTAEEGLDHTQPLVRDGKVVSGAWSMSYSEGRTFR
jgi:hypothetical protein